jgi:hypothetical protein
MLPYPLGQLEVYSPTCAAVLGHVLSGKPCIDNQAGAELEGMGLGTGETCMQGIQQCLGGNLGGLGIASWPWQCRHIRHCRQAVWIGVVCHCGGGLTGFGPAGRLGRRGAMDLIAVVVMQLVTVYGFGLRAEECC